MARPGLARPSWRRPGACQAVLEICLAVLEACQTVRALPGRPGGLPGCPRGLPGRPGGLPSRPKACLEAVQVGVLRFPLQEAPRGSKRFQEAPRGLTSTHSNYKTWMSCIVISCHYLPVSGLRNLRACCLFFKSGNRFSGSLSGIET